MMIVGVDASLTATGFCIGRPWTTPEVGTITSTARDGGAADPKRIRKIAGGLFRRLPPMADEPAVVMMEAVPLGQIVGGSVHDLVGLRTVLAYGLHARGYRLVDHIRKPKKKNGRDVSIDQTGRGIQPSSIKLFALGKGGGTGTDKDAMILACRDRLPNIHISNNNEADAAWLWAMAAVHFGDSKYEDGLGVRNMDALKGIDWPEFGDGEQ